MAAFFSWNSLMWFLAVAYAGMILTLIAVVLGENRNPLKSLAWVTTLLLFPVGGMVLYFFFGRSLRHVRVISRRKRRKLRSGDRSLPLPKLSNRISSENRRRVRLVHAVDGAVTYTGNELEVFTDGREHFDSLFADLRAAKEYINLQFYIIAHDRLGHELRDILIERAEAGVKVRVIYDYIGSFDALRHDFFHRMKAHGVEVHSFFRISVPDKLTRLNWRNHRKVVIIDGRVGYIGGMNVADRYISGGRFGKWRDTAVRFTGSAVAGLQYNFAVDWQFMGHGLLTDPVNSLPEGREKAVKDALVQIITSGPTNRWGNTAFLFFKAISGARRRVWLQTPYFLPSESLLKALQSAALSGVDVRVMVPRRTDSSISTYASHSYFEECMLAGIKILLYEPGMLHAKVLLVDDDFVTLGSTNFDFRSFEHNFEENIVIYSEEATRLIASKYVEDSKECTRLKLSEWNSRPQLLKAKESICRLLSPIL